MLYFFYAAQPSRAARDVRRQPQLFRLAPAAGLNGSGGARSSNQNGHLEEPSAPRKANAAPQR
jgi:hypothetical protein